MFTGLIQGEGRLRLEGERLRIETSKDFSEIVIGDSVAVDGVCLTATHVTNESFQADVSQETLDRTTLGWKAKRNDFVNLEPALRLNDRLGGHLVSGHIDGLGKVLQIQNLKTSWNIEISWHNKSYTKYICEKGSICINGISLTVARFSENGMNFEVAVIPHTWMNTTLKNLSVGDFVNLEADMIAKYAERLLMMQKESVDKSESISTEWLSTHGWV